jgi:hypothetical protein
MAYQKLQVSTAINVIPSNNDFIPFPGVAKAGTVTSVVANQLVDSTANFITNGIEVGDVVYNTTTNTIATVVQVVSATVILLNTNIFSTIGNAYSIYSQNTKSEGCVLYIGTGGNIRIQTAGGQDVVFVNVLGGTFLPIQVLKVFATSTTASNIVALW